MDERHDGDAGSGGIGVPVVDLTSLHDDLLNRAIQMRDQARELVATAWMLRANARHLEDVAAVLSTGATRDPADD